METSTRECGKMDYSMEQENSIALKMIQSHQKSGEMEKDGLGTKMERLSDKPQSQRRRAG
jgi:hypothetical protein